ncbi:hypothetical protein [Bythopirellula goksoeyrii]|uniref:Uncharacterized protein n=1 Tax=Bythopirellula goksoeyrii TaxID=1400387 RepID=A0A5B9QFA8_9BACT|nr:hypothetical protein [Bythopirellula goksoeyrii]QEG36222.1 hypothetical protein Pr1d_35340 [Bythopirellula goksoeyrii]
MPSEKAALPAKEFQLGTVRVTIWHNESEFGRGYYRSNFHKIYRLSESDRKKDDNGWRDTGSFAPEDLPVIAELCRLTTDWFQQQAAVISNRESA